MLPNPGKASQNNYTYTYYYFNFGFCNDPFSGLNKLIVLSIRSLSMVWNSIMYCLIIMNNNNLSKPKHKTDFVPGFIKFSLLFIYYHCPESLAIISRVIKTSVSFFYACRYIQYYVERWVCKLMLLIFCINKFCLLTCIRAYNLLTMWPKKESRWFILCVFHLPFIICHSGGSFCEKQLWPVTELICRL